MDHHSCIASKQLRNRSPGAWERGLLSECSHKYSPDYSNITFDVELDFDLVPEEYKGTLADSFLEWYIIRQINGGDESCLVVDGNGFGIQLGPTHTRAHSTGSQQRSASLHGQLQSTNSSHAARPASQTPLRYAAEKARPASQTPLRNSQQVSSNDKSLFGLFHFSHCIYFYQCDEYNSQFVGKSFNKGQVSVSGCSFVSKSDKEVDGVVLGEYELILLDQGNSPAGHNVDYIFYVRKINGPESECTYEGDWGKYVYPDENLPAGPKADYIFYIEKINGPESNCTYEGDWGKYIYPD
ncbi:hypothetical protein T265_15459, partial [Opisthorchis viverrini]